MGVETMVSKGSNIYGLGVKPQSLRNTAGASESGYFCFFGEDCDSGALLFLFDGLLITNQDNNT